MDKKIIVFIGNAVRHIYFANQINNLYPLSGIVVEKKYSTKNRLLNFLKKIHYNPLKLIKKLYYKIYLNKMDQRYKKAQIDILLDGNVNIGLPNTCPIIYTDNINSEKTKEFVENLKPHLILVSGTSLVKRDIINSMPQNTIINMHTGLSPYYRGGPCTFWCLYNEEIEYLGVTIHFLTTGIDSGNIIISRRMTDIKSHDNEATLDCKVIKLGISLMLEAINGFLNNNLNPVPQWEKGRVFSYKDFTPQKRLDLEKRLKNGLIERYSKTKDSIDFDYIKTVG